MSFNFQNLKLVISQSDLVFVYYSKLYVSRD